MSLKIEYGSRDEIPEEFRNTSLYEERNGRFYMRMVDGMKTQTDVDKLQRSLHQSREAERAAIASLKAFEGIDPADHKKLSADYELLKAKLEAGDPGSDKFQELLTQRVEAEKHPLLREIEELREKSSKMETAYTALKEADTKRQIHESMLKCLPEGFVKSAQEDALFLAERIFEFDEATGKVVTKQDNALGISPFLDPAAAFPDILKSRPHWMGQTSGTGSQGGNQTGAPVKNPFKEGPDFNLTEQSRLMTENRELALQLQKQANTK